MHTDNRLHFLDGLRGWGSLMVLLGHVFGEGLPVSPEFTAYLPPLVIFNAGLAIWIFFIVSGFSLSIQYCRTRDAATLVRTSLGRYVRLAIPILIASGLVFLAFRAGLVVDASSRPPGLRTALTSEPSFWHTIKFSLFDVFFKYDPARTLLPPAWTMPFELWGSLLVLGTLFVIGRLQKRFAVYFLLSLLSFAINPLYVAFLVGLVFAEFYSGNVLEKHKDKITFAAIALTIPAIIACSFLPRAASAFPLQERELYLFASALLAFSLIFNTYTARILSGRISRFLGRISFPLYLIHPLLLHSFASHAYQLAAPDSEALSDLTKFALNMLTVVVSLAVAWLLVPADQAGIRIARLWVSYFTRKPATSGQPTSSKTV